MAVAVVAEFAVEVVVVVGVEEVVVVEVVVVEVVVVGVGDDETVAEEEMVPWDLHVLLVGEDMDLV